MATRGCFLRLRDAAACRTCGRPLARGEQAWWDGGVSCAGCHAPDRALDRGEAGRSAMAEFERRRAAREERIDRRFGPFAGVVKFLAVDPQSTTAWSAGAEGERRVGAYLDRAVGGRGVVLHDRRIPGTRVNIDHLVVVPSGLWVVDTKHYRGTVARRDVGGWRRHDGRLYVGRRDCSKLVTGLRWQLDVVEHALADRAVCVVGALCFVDAEWPWFARAFQLGGIWVTWPKDLAARIGAGGPLGRDAIDRLSSRVARRLVPA